MLRNAYPKEELVPNQWHKRKLTHNFRTYSISEKVAYLLALVSHEKQHSCGSFKNYSYLVWFEKSLPLNWES